jgi:hypothetical protein
MDTINKLYPSLQSKIVLITGLFVVLFFNNKPSALKITMGILGVLVNAYLINCLVHGDCGIMAWLYVAMNILGTYVIMAGLK